LLKCTITCLKLVLIKILMTFLKHFFIYQNQKTFFHVCSLQLFSMHEVKSNGLLLIQAQCLVLLYPSQKAGFLVTRLFMIINENLFLLYVTFSEKWSEKGRQRSTSLNCQVEILRYEWVHLLVTDFKSYCIIIAL